VALREHENSGNSTIGLEVMQMAMKNGCSRDFSGFSQSCLNDLGVVKICRTPQVDEQMISSELEACFLTEVVLSVGSGVPLVGGILLSCFVV